METAAVMHADVTTRFRALLASHREDLIKHWQSAVANSLRGRQSEAELARQTEELYVGLVVAAEAEQLDVAAPESGELRAVLADLSRSRALQGFSPSETAVSVFAFKDALSAVDADIKGPRDFVEYNRFIDAMGLFTFETYAKAREELIADQTQQLLELSTPVVKLWDGVLAVPLVGTLDSARAQVVMERLLQGLVDTASPYAIIDITGVPAVDTQVAQHILKTVVAARLMGADCVISGIRPQIAQTIVALGIEFNDIVTKASLADALSHTLRGAGVELVRANGRRTA
jgi:rsbT co-antagonist protein RsbR